MAEGGRLDPAVWVMTPVWRRENPQLFSPASAPRTWPTCRLGLPTRPGTTPRICTVTPAWRLITPFANGTSTVTAAPAARATHASAWIARTCTRRQARPN